MSVGAGMLLFRLEYKTSVIFHSVNTQNIKFARKDRPHILASHRCEAYENLLHIDIAPVRRTLSRILHSKNWTMIFISINIYSFYLADKIRLATVNLVSTRKICKFSRTLYNRQLIQLASIRVVRSVLEDFKIARK